MILGIDPKVDYGFKHTFGRDSTRPILINLIDSVLDPSPTHRILDITLDNPFMPKEALDEKLSILDVKARDLTGRQFNVEMQMLAARFFKQRILYYLCKLYQQQLHEGEDYLVLRPSISIIFINDVLSPNVPDYHLHYRMLEQSHHFPWTDDLGLHVLELPKFTKSLPELTSDLDRWLYFLRNAQIIDLGAVPAALQQPMIMRAFEELKMLTQNDLERERYESRRKAQLDHNSWLKEARMDRDEGRLEGQFEEKTRFIHSFERMLNRPETPLDQLSGLSLDALTKLADDLLGQLLKQR